MKWDDEKPLHFYVSGAEFLSTFELSFCVDRSHGSAGDDVGTVSVINGNRLLLTPFRETGIPPPLSAYQITFPHQVERVVYPSGKESTNNSLAVFHGGNVTIMHSAAHDTDLEDFGCKVDYRLGRSDKFKIRFLVHKIASQLNLDAEFSEKISENVPIHCTWMKSNFYCIFNSKTVYVLMTDGNMMKIDIPSEAISINSDGDKVFIHSVDNSAYVITNESSSVSQIVK